mmetsp:Transcript_484/g.1694  ORF Transcript_484/g.1694 Transcript_484/m.1694 type:complete len:277 (-) Transcript_484:1104-1934(-)
MRFESDNGFRMTIMSNDSFRLSRMRMKKLYQRGCTVALSCTHRVGKCSDNVFIIFRPDRLKNFKWPLNIAISIHTHLSPTFRLRFPDTSHAFIDARIFRRQRYHPITICGFRRHSPTHYISIRTSRYEGARVRVTEFCYIYIMRVRSTRRCAITWHIVSAHRVDWRSFACSFIIYFTQIEVVTKQSRKRESTRICSPNQSRSITIEGKSGYSRETSSWSSPTVYLLLPLLMLIFRRIVVIIIVVVDVVVVVGGIVLVILVLVPIPIDVVVCRRLRS